MIVMGTIVGWLTVLQTNPEQPSGRVDYAARLGLAASGQGLAVGCLLGPGFGLGDALVTGFGVGLTAWRFITPGRITLLEAWG